MKSRLRKYARLFAVYDSLPEDVKRVLLKNKDKDWIHIISELCLNIQKKNIPLSKTQIKKLKKYSKAVKNFSNKKTGINKRRKYLIQKGAGFIPLLISLAAPFITKLLGI